jgi:peptidoglycan hydrolase-like protein with peptidoglycan-binding domain
MRRYGRRRRPIPPQGDRWAEIIDGCGLSVVTGPYPCEPDEDVPLGCFTRSDLRDWQRWHGLTVDGRLGPQTWVALARYNDQVRSM